MIHTPRILFVLLSLLGTSTRGASETWKDKVYAKVDGTELKLDLFVPSPPGAPKLLVWLHGGDGRGGSKSSVPLKPVLDHGFPIASVEYRLTDKALFPAQIHDC